ncbi:SPOR domain-containing protein [Pseudomonas aeruginosa]|nr:SPOR domain-containing protein [Pseudomonas aeruginosa]RCI54293.1 SPOR domain-containing protein [Pseudomonas aeruginosa]RCI74798.1 SPOR domain-containing protein [Pseudomonas aeruginosa]
MPIKPDAPDPSTSTPYWVTRVSVAGRSEWLLSNLEELHYPVFTEKSGDGVLRIFVGPWKKRESAEAQLAMLRVEMGVDGFVMMYKN